MASRAGNRVKVIYVVLIVALVIVAYIYGDAIVHAFKS